MSAQGYENQRFSHYAVLARGDDGAVFEDEQGKAFYFGHPFKGKWEPHYKDLDDFHLVKEIFGQSAKLLLELDFQSEHVAS
jgi:hypothetical protein